MIGLLAQLGGAGAVTALVLLLLRAVLVAVVALWSLKADKEGRKHALELLRTLKLALPARDRSP
ncbi:hypothetical protein [Actinosynnema sp. NPDC023587]|uniref:hypothetical protein n=1 Tax=Actinosynnema sp. NPDC023587 TaxID=3154695 RepID=UPI00340723D4